MKKNNRPLSKFALLGKIYSFCADSPQNFESMCKHMGEKFCDEDAKKVNFNKRMGFRKRSNRPLSKFALLGKIYSFCADSPQNFESMCKHMGEKFCDEDAKKVNFNKRMGFRKRSNLIAFTLFSLLAFTSCEKPPAPPPKLHEVTVTKPLVCDVPYYVDYIGHMVAKTSVQVMSQVSGTIYMQYFTEGQEVKRGDLLLLIDPRPYEAALAKSKAQLAQTLATLHYNRETTTRYAPLVQQDFISQLNYDQYVTNVLTSEATIGQNKADLEAAQINLGYCYLMSPVDGITGKLQVKPGNYVDANANTELTLLNQIQPILVDFWVPETDLLTIQEKQRAGELKLVVYPDPAHKHSFSGDLTLIDNQVNTDTGAILLEGTLPNDEKILWPGHFVDVRLILSEKKNAILVPNQAVMVGQKGHYVFVVKADSSIIDKPVKIGQRFDDSYISIESGITAKDVVVIEGQLNLYPGMKVDVKNPLEDTGEWQ